jgi:hypothetical protein
MNRLLLPLVLVCLAVGVIPCRADWIVQQPASVPPVPPPAVVGDGCCCSPCQSSWCRPGLLARIRERLHARHCDCCCHPHPGLLERIRMRRAERRASWCQPCCP